MLQQLYPYRHAYLSLYLVTYADNQAYHIFIHVQAMHISYTRIMSITCIHMRYFQTVFLYDHVLNIARISVHVIIFHITITFVKPVKNLNLNFSEKDKTTICRNSPGGKDEIF